MRMCATSLTDVLNDCGPDLINCPRTPHHGGLLFTLTVLSHANTGNCITHSQQSKYKHKNPNKHQHQHVEISDLNVKNDFPLNRTASKRKKYINAVKKYTVNYC